MRRDQAKLIIEVPQIRFKKPKFIITVQNEKRRKKNSPAKRRQRTIGMHRMAKTNAESN